ncbi:Fungal-trans domain-containing protein [Fusarium sp. Ph1]|nr:Fungal-trans domain-containing protein [Fusarium sp. Ph1]
MKSLEARVQEQSLKEQSPQPQQPAMTPPRSTMPSDQLSGIDPAILSPTEQSSHTQSHSDTATGSNTQVPCQIDPALDSPEFNRNPLVDNGEVFARDPHGKFWYMGPTSSWAFCRRVLAIIGSCMPKPEPPVYPWDLETINLAWSPVGLYDHPDVSGLPSCEYALYLLSTVQYHLGSLYEIIDHEPFREQVERFYQDPAGEAYRSRFWYSQFLLVLAFGEAFLSTGSNKGVPGIKYASRGLSLIPSLIPLDKDKESLAVVQAHCLAALYLQAVDLRLMAFQIIGQGLRLALIEGWHRHMPPEDVGEQHSKRCNTIFWISYIIDREYGPLVGAPSSIRDEDITTKLPSDIDSSLRADALTLQIRMSRLTATILNGVYGVDRNFDGTLLNDTQSVLHSLADVSRDISAFLDTRLHKTNIRSSKIATRLILSYHHCVVLTTRPLVMCVLQRRLTGSDGDRTIPDGPISSLLQSCVHSALNILKTLRALGDENLLDCFLPFQMETVFSSAFLLYVIDAVSPGFVPDQTWLATAHGIFDTMIAKGSPATPLRKRELQRLEQIMTSYLGSRSQANPAPLQFQEVPILGRGMDLPDQPVATDAAYVDETSPWGLLGSHGGYILSPGEIMQLAEGLNMEDFMVTPEEDVALGEHDQVETNTNRDTGP